MAQPGLIRADHEPEPETSAGQAAASLAEALRINPALEREHGAALERAGALAPSNP